jgi:hypothetical protein
MTMAPISRDIAWFIALLLPQWAPPRPRRRSRVWIWRDKSSGPLPPALLTNAFANPLEVCAAGAIIMTPSHLLLQRTSLCCAKMPVSVLDDGGEAMAIAIGDAGSPRRLLGANLAPLGPRKGPGVGGSKEPPGL